MRYVQLTLQSTILGSVFWTGLRKQWETHLVMCAGRPQPYLPPAAYGGGPGASYYTAPTGGSGVGGTVGSPVGSGRARLSEGQLAMDLSTNPSLRRRLLSGAFKTVSAGAS